MFVPRALGSCKIGLKNEEIEEIGNEWEISNKLFRLRFIFNNFVYKFKIWYFLLLLKCK